jgi:hypothetical protein
LRSARGIERKQATKRSVERRHYYNGRLEEQAYQEVSSEVIRLGELIAVNGCHLQVNEASPDTGAMW